VSSSAASSRSDTSTAEVAATSGIGVLATGVSGGATEDERCTKNMLSAVAKQLKNLQKHSTMI